MPHSPIKGRGAVSHTPGRFDARSIDLDPSAEDPAADIERQHAADRAYGHAGRAHYQQQPVARYPVRSVHQSLPGL